MDKVLFRLQIFLSVMTITIWMLAWNFQAQLPNHYFLLASGFLISSLLIWNIFIFKHFYKLEVNYSELNEKNKELKNEIEISKERIAKFSVFGAHANRLNALIDLSSGLAHEINNPLSMLQFRFQRIRRSLDNQTIDKDVILSEVNKLDEITNRIAIIVRSLRDFAKDGHQEPFEEIGLYSTVQGALALIQEKLKQDNILVTTNELDKELTLECRTSHLVQVIMNLLSNSADAIRGTQEAWIDISAKEKHGQIIISVTDSGHGIDEKNISKLFEPFFTTKAPGKGMGLGLSVAFGIINGHGGKLYYDKDSKNTKFVIEIPKFQNGVKELAS